MEITFIYIAQKDKMFAREEQLHNTASTTLTANICTDSMLPQSVVKAVYMLTPAQQPEPAPQQVTKAVMSSQACSILAFISTCACFYRRITVTVALKLLVLLILCSHVNTTGLHACPH